MENAKISTAHYFVRMWAIVRFQSVGFHRWVDAPDETGYLRNLHRHNFHFEVMVSVRHADREVEYHELLSFCKEQVGDDRIYDRKSCEQIALDLIGQLKTRYGEQRDFIVRVFEDGEVGAEVQYISAIRPS